MERSAAMTIEDKIERARKMLPELEAREGQILAYMRGLLGDLEEELRTLRRESEREQIEFFTEREFATRLKVSEATIARERQAARLEPLVIRGRIRYTSEHLRRAGEIFGQNGQGANGKHRRPRKKQ